MRYIGRTGLMSAVGLYARCIAAGDAPAMTVTDPEHRFPLGSTGWSLWRDAVLRSTGFPAAGLDRLTQPDCATVADAHLRGTATAEAFRSRFEAALADCTRELRAIAAHPLLREAILWQNQAFLAMLDSFIDSDPAGPRNRRRRVRERRLTRYWQRYCGKSETIGFFGPSLWVTLTRDIRHVRAVPGPELVELRRVFLEPWVLMAYAARLADDPGVRPWLPPSRIPHYTLDGELLRRPGLAPVPLSRQQAAALARCDGRTPALVVAGALRRDPALGLEQEVDGLRVLADLVSRGLLTWDANLRLGPHTAAELRERIAAIGDPDARHRAQEGLDRLESARSEVADAAGDPDALAVALSKLDDEFVKTTGQQPTRRPGQMYAGRGLCFEDTTRDLRLLVGSALLDDLAPALGVVLQVARWITHELAEAYEEAFGRLLTDVRERCPHPSLGDLWPAAYALLFGDGQLPATAVWDELADRWSALFGLAAEPDRRWLRFSSRELRDEAARLFACDRPGWSLARVHSPDIQICAPSVDAINAGDYLAVLGELHIASATMCDRTLTWSRSEPGRLLDLAIQDTGGHRLVPLLRPVLSKDAGRTVMVEPAPGDTYIGVGRASGIDASRLVPMGAIAVSAGAGGLVGTLPDGTNIRLLEFFARLLSGVVANALREGSRARHTPRISVDRLVVSRETWRLSLDDVAELLTHDEEALYLGARRLVARLSLPDRCYAKISTEVKPVYVDFTSPAYLGSLSAMLRSARDTGKPVVVTLTEMLPTPEETWVPDAAGRTYFSELRLQVTDPVPAATQVSPPLAPEQAMQPS